MSSGGFEGLEDFVTNKLGWKVHEHVGPAVFNPRAAKQLTFDLATGEELDRLAQIIGLQRGPSVSDIDFRSVIRAFINGDIPVYQLKEEYIPWKTRWEQIAEEIEDGNY